MVPRSLSLYPAWMHRRLSFPLALGLVLLASACPKEPKPGTAAPLGATVLPAINIPISVPASASGVMVVRTRESIYAAFANINLFGNPALGEQQAIKTELDDFLRARLGVTLTSVNQATLFFTANEGMALVLENVGGAPSVEPSLEHHGVPLYRVDGMVVAVCAGEFIVGEQAAVELAVATATGHAPALGDRVGSVLEALVVRSEGVFMAAAVDVARLPPALKVPAKDLGIEHAQISYGVSGVHVTLDGPPEAMETLHGQFTEVLDQISTSAERSYQEVLESDRVWEGIPAIIGYHEIKRIRAQMVPTLEGRQLHLHVPLHFEDPLVFTTFTGMIIAFVIPALDKYMARAKTSEALVDVAMMFDSTATFLFDEGRIREGIVAASEAPVARIRCPSDGRALGSAGITPPLDLRCAEGPQGMCVPVSGQPRGPGEYSMNQWIRNPVWQEMNFVKESPHAFHYDFRWHNTEEREGTCQFTVQVFGDLDDDGLFSTFERSGAADNNGLNAAAGLYIDRQLE